MRVPPVLQRYLAETFSIDLRTLALFRAGLGTVLGVTLLLRFADLTAFYADVGVMPRAWLLMSESPLRWSLHFANGSALFQGTLLALQALLAFCLAVGYRTRLAVVFSWVLLVSLHSRNPLALMGGDYLLVCLLFWGMFLPLAARWSVDAALSTAPPPAETRVLSWASAGVVLQTTSVYFFSALLKSDAVWWPDGTAVQHALMMDRFVLPIGIWLREDLPWLLKPLTYYVYFLELIGPLLVLSPVFQRPLRFAVLLMLVGMHLGFALCLAIGHFPYASWTSLTVLLGGWFWDWLGQRRDHGRHLKIYYDEPCGFCLKSCLLLRHLLILPRTELLPAQGSARAHALMQAQDSWVVIDGEDVAHTKWNAFVALLRHSLLLGWAWRLAALRLWERPGNAVYDWVARHRGAFGTVTGALLPMREVRFFVPAWTQAFAAVVLVAVLSWNLTSVKALPVGTYRALVPILYPIRMDQFWDMFAPYPGRRDGWFVAPGQLVDGTEVDVLRPRQQGVDFTKPARISATIKNVRWQSFHTRLNDARFRHHRLPYARYLCRQWNAGAAEAGKLSRFRLTYMLEETRLDGTTAPVEQIVIWHHDCLAREAPAGESGTGEP
jgi:predicted DCC family thiol-disulfide oxidoreductase YuxK